MITDYIKKENVKPKVILKLNIFRGHNNIRSLQYPRNPLLSDRRSPFPRCLVRSRIFPLQKLHLQIGHQVGNHLNEFQRLCVL